MEEERKETIIEEQKEIIIDEEERPVHVPGGKPAATYILLAANILVWLFSVIYGYRSGVDANLKLGAKFNPLIMDGEYWRLVTPIFLHGGILHLLMNSYSLYAVGPAVERLFGHIRFIALYLFAGVMGSIASFYFSPNPSVGASGAIFGLMGALGYVALQHRETFGRSLGSNILVILAINLAYGFSRSGIDNSAHIGGLAGGFLIAAALSLPYDRTSVGKRIAALGLALTLAAGGIYVGFMKPENVEMKKEYDAGTAINQGIESFNSQNYARAEELARHALELDPGDKELRADIYYLLTASVINQNKGSMAVGYAKTLTELQPKSGHYLLGLCYLQSEEPEQAKAELEKALELNPENKHAKELLDQLKQQSVK